MSDTHDASPPRDPDLGRGGAGAGVDADVPQLDADAGLTSAETGQDGSDVSSVNTSLVDALPRRAGSPADSLLSGQGNSPSVQVSRARPAVADSTLAQQPRDPSCPPPAAASSPLRRSGPA